MMCGSAICSSLCHPGFHRQGRHSPAVQHCRATHEASGTSTMGTMSKVTNEFDVRNPFMPSLPSACHGLELLVIVAVISAAIGTTVAALILSKSDMRPFSRQRASAEQKLDAETVAHIKRQILGA